MQTPTEETKRQSRWQRRIVVIAGVLFPLMVIGGVLAPQVVTVITEGDAQQVEQGESEALQLDFSIPFQGKKPLRLPRNFEAGFLPELLDLQNLFSGASHSEDLMSRQYARLLGFPRSHGDVIVMDDVDRKIQDIIFKDPIMVGAVTALKLPDPGDFDDSRPLGDGLRFDDPQASGSGVSPVPEPGPAPLILLGLAALGYRRRS